MNSRRTAHSALLEWARKTPDKVFLHQPVDGEIRQTTWLDAADAAQRMASALLEFGFEPGDRVAILAKNSAEWILADIAIAMAGLVSVPIYPTAAPATVAHILSHSEAKLVFVGKLDDHDRTMTGVPAEIPRIAFPYETINGCQHQWLDLLAKFSPLANPANPNMRDVMTILYTSGSTGLPKGVVLSFDAYAYASNAAIDCVKATSADHFFSYLPMAHITERTVTGGPVIYSGGECSFVESLQTFPRDLKRARPTLFISVPRLWVKFQSGVHARISPAKLKLLLAIPIIGRKVAQKICRELGFDSCRHFGSGSAPISPATLRWYQKLGINIGEGWGMSETAGLSCGNTPFSSQRVGTIGMPVKGTEMKLSDGGEILIRSPGLFTEYFKDTDLTQEVFTADGFFRTGDKAEWSHELQAFTITGRVKDIFKSAKGKYVTPVPIEAKLSSNPLVEQVCVMGAGLTAPIAAIVVTEAGRALQRSEVENSFSKLLSSVNATLESHEKMSNIVLVRDDWTTENELLTPTLKLKRDKLEEKYGSVISAKLAKSIVWQ